MTYNYYEAVKDDVLYYINENINLEDYETLDDLREYLNDELFTEDSVTGSASGSYTFSPYKAEENICHNLNLLREALQEFGFDPGYLLENGAEAADVIIRCYLLGSVISKVLDELEDEFDKVHS